RELRLDGGLLVLDRLLGLHDELRICRFGFGGFSLSGVIDLDGHHFYGVRFLLWFGRIAARRISGHPNHHFRDARDRRPRRPQPIAYHKLFSFGGRLLRIPYRRTKSSGSLPPRRDAILTCQRGWMFPSLARRVGSSDSCKKRTGASYCFTPTPRHSHAAFMG